MIVRTKRKTESFLGRVFSKTSQHAKSSPLLTEQEFRQELFKEMYRADRRSKDRDFGLIRVIFSKKKSIDSHAELIEKFRERLRITDSAGWYESSLAFLLPETNKEGTLQAANHLAKIAEEEGVAADTEVSIYPWDDELIALSDELKTLQNDSKDSNKPPHDSDGAGGNGSTRNGASKFKESSNGSSQSNSGQTLCVANGLVTEKRHDFVKSIPNPWWKRTVDVVGSGFGLLMLSPVLIGAAVAIKMTSKGPVFFRQLREGKNGQSFGILKFRTMVIDAEAKQADLLGQNEQDGPAFKIKNDPRITSVGRYLRKSCVDELPQLINVLIGQMSLVGPRPLPIHESHGCEAWQRTRLTVLPGLTCTWQAHGGRDVKFAEWMRMDLEYIEKQSFWFDLKLIFETAFLAIMHKGSV
ncbi:MAG: sugar transferase [Mariniblastus sp.]